jgi:hypothetical protein
MYRFSNFFLRTLSSTHWWSLPQLTNDNSMRAADV